MMAVAKVASGKSLSHLVSAPSTTPGEATPAHLPLCMQSCKLPVTNTRYKYHGRFAYVDVDMDDDDDDDRDDMDDDVDDDMDEY